MPLVKRPQLFMLHFAGGNCYSFQPMLPYLKDFETEMLELPGRGRRIGETLIKDFDLAARDISAQILQRLHTPVYLIYGHSLGAYLALKAGCLIRDAGREPSYLVVSGNAGLVMREICNVHLMDCVRFVIELLSLGGVSPERRARGGRGGGGGPGL